MKKIFLIITLLCLTLPALAQNEAETRHIAEQLRCPVCRGIPIADSPSELAQDMMKVIREKQREGLTEDQILAYFNDRYGDWILLNPKKEGMNIFLWVTPWILLVLGLLFLVWRMSKWRRS